MDNKITIIEGPTPNFNSVETDFIMGINGWTAGLSEGPYLYDTAKTILRTFNGAALIERCHKAWTHKTTMFLEYRDPIGMKKEVPIVAARALDAEDGDLLVLWVRKDPEEDQEADIDIDFDDMDNDW
ncbi:MAG: hypothetical protein SVP52_08395 [Chloroflexota bacterium]|nr:hypothetical protein [Chloroflexota bacterium]